MGLANHSPPEKSSASTSLPSQTASPTTPQLCMHRKWPLHKTTRHCKSTCRLAPYDAIRWTMCVQSLNTHLIPSNEQSSRFSVWVDCGRGYSNRVESSKSQLIFRQWPLLYSVERVEKVRKGCTETDIEGSSTTARFVIPFCFIVFSKISHSRIQP